MAIHIRNCKLSPASTSNQGAAIMGLFMREMFLVGGWSEDSVSGTNWNNANNILVDQAAGANGFTVAAANPRQIVDQAAVGRFTQAMVDDKAVIALRGSTNDQNYSMWRIVEYIDANTIKVDPTGFSPFGWVDETNMAGRIVVANTLNLLATNDFAIMDAPSGNNQARWKIVNNVGVYCYARPRGQLADTTEVPGSDTIYIIDDDDYYIVVNAYFDGPNAVIYAFADSDGARWGMHWGEIDVDDAVSDPSPGFVHDLTGYGSSISSEPIYCLNAAGSQEIAYFMTPKIDQSTTNTATLLDVTWATKLNGRPSRVPLYRAMVWMGTSRWLRGNSPVLRFINQLIEPYRKIDPSGAYRHFYNGIVVPMNGPNDQPLIKTGQ